MQYDNSLSWFNSPSLPSSSTLSDPFYLGPQYLLSLPTPQRRAPPPPISSPRRRRRPRHIRMQEPASKGLFTLLEVDEAEENDSVYGSEYTSSWGGEGLGRIMSARASSEVLSRSPVRQRLDLPQDVGVYEGDTEELVSVEKRLSWVSASTATCDSPSDNSSPPTPLQELDDPFFVDVPLDIDLADIDVSYTSYLAASPLAAFRPRRPPPLDLTRTHPYAYSAEINRWYTDVESATPKAASIPTPSSSRDSLLPSLPILSSAQYQSLRQARTPSPPRSRPSPPLQPRFSQRKSRSAPAPSSHCPNPKDDPFDLVAALEDLLASCGEPEDIASFPSHSHWSDSDSDSDSEPERNYTSFPLPPPRTPVLSPASASSTSSFGVGGPVTPRTPRFHSSLPPIPTPRDQKKRTPIQPRMTGDHSFLFNLSSDATPSPLAARYNILPRAGSVERSNSRGSGDGSSRSGRLPPRSQLPVEWTRV